MDNKSVLVVEVTELKRWFRKLRFAKLYGKDI